GRPPLEHDASARHAGEVEQVVDDAPEVADLAGEDRGRSGVLRAAIGALEEVDGARDRGERVAQLVAEQGQELVLRAAHRVEARALTLPRGARPPAAAGDPAPPPRP